MPQYLAIDYLNDALCRKQATLSRMLIACPPHVMKSNNVCQNFMYREPWLKGNFKIDSKEMIKEAKADLDSLTCKISKVESPCLQFADVQYHFSGFKCDEIVPSSNSNSDSEQYNGKNISAVCTSVDSLSQDMIETFSFQPEPKCCILTLGSIDANVCGLSCSCNVLEPLISADDLQPVTPQLDSLLEKLNVFSIPDPTDIVESTVTKLFKDERFVSDFDETSDLCSATSLSGELLAMPYLLKTHELDEDILVTSLPPMQDLMCNISSELESFKLDGDSFAFAKCAEDLGRLVDDVMQQNLLNECELVNEVEHLKSDFHSIDSSSCDNFVLKESMPTAEDSLMLLVPLVLDKHCFIDSDVETAMVDLDVVNEDLPSNDFVLLKQTLMQLKHYIKSEMMPSVGKDSLLHYIFPEPRMVTSVSISPEDFLTVTNLLKSLNVEPIANGSKLDLSLPWDPVKHASVEMGYARSLLKREGLEEKVNEKMHHPFSSIYSETFESILNKSVDGHLSIDKKRSSLHENYPDILSVTTKPVSTVCSSTAVKQVNVEALSNSETTQSKDAVSRTQAERKTSMNSHNLDPLSNFMMLMGKQLEKLPWSTSNSHAAVVDAGCASNTLVNRVDGKNLAVKRIRTAKLIDNTANCSKNFLTDAKNEFPNKKLKRNVTQTPSMLMFSEVARKSKLSKTIQVNITGHNLQNLGIPLDIACAIEKEVLPLIENLKSTKILPADAALPTISRDTTRFLLKQQEKLIEDEVKNSEKPSFKNTLCQLQALHQVVSTFYLVVQVSFTSALALLHSFVQRLHDSSAPGELQEYANLYKQCIQKLKFFLCQGSKDAVNEPPALVHPKIVELRSRLAKWFFKQKRAHAESSYVVIVCTTRCRYLFMKLCKELSKPDSSFKEVDIKPISVVVDVDKLNKEDIFEAFQRHNVLIIGEQMVFEDFPWSVVNLVVEYEYQEDSPLKSLCTKLMIKHYCLQSMLPNVAMNLKANRSDQTYDVKATNIVSPADDKPCTVLIGSAKFTALGNLLHLMETRYEMLVIERDYSRLQSETFHPDLILDAQTCFLLEDVLDLQEKGLSVYTYGASSIIQSLLRKTVFELKRKKLGKAAARQIFDFQGGERVKTLLSILMMLRRKFIRCYVVIMSKVKDKEVYPLGGSAPLNIARLQASIKQLNRCSKDFQVEVLCCFTIQSVAEAIYKQVEKRAKADHSKKDRSWISNDMEAEEQFLLHFPSINSFVAQRLLSVTTLNEICRMSREELVSTSDAVDIPGKVIQDFYHCLHAKFESTANCVVDHEVEIIQQPVPEEKDIDSTATRYSIVNSNNTHIWSSTVERSNCFENDNTKKSPGPCDVKLEFLRPDFDLDADRFDAEMKHPYFSQMNFKESQGCSSNFAMPEIQMPVQKQDNFNGNYFALGNEISLSNQNGVDKLLLSAQKKLEEFVRLNPERAKTDANNLVPSLKSLFSGSVSSSFFPGIVSSSIFRSNDFSVRPNVTTYQENFPNNNSSEARPFLRSHSSLDFNMKQENPNSTDEQPSCSYQPVTSHFPTSILKRPSREDYSFENYGSSLSEDNQRTIAADCYQYDMRSSDRNEIVAFQTSLPMSSYFSEAMRSSLHCRDGMFVTGTSGSANIGIAQPFLQHPWSNTEARNLACDSPFVCDRSNIAVMTPNVRKKVLAYEKIPGSKDGQTRLTFY